MRDDRLRAEPLCRRGRPPLHRVLGVLCIVSVIRRAAIWKNSPKQRKRLNQCVACTASSKPHTAVWTARCSSLRSRGVMSNLSSQLRQQNALHRLNEIIDEIPRVREDLGWIPRDANLPDRRSQATFNVLLGRYKIIANHTANLLKGLYGEDSRAGQQGIAEKGPERQSSNHGAARRIDSAGVA